MESARLYDSALSSSGEVGTALSLHEGWLYKKGRIHKNWKRRWMVLRGPQLFYFTQPHLKDVHTLALFYYFHAMRF